MKWAVAIEAGAIERGQQGTRDRNGKMAKEGDLIREGERRQTEECRRRVNNTRGI